MPAQDKGRVILKKLMEKGVRVPCPESVEIGQDIQPERISGDRVTIHSGCRLNGAETLIMAGVDIGQEAPVTIHNCHLGEGVRLKGGFFQKATFLSNSAMGSGAHVREGCLLEEGARGAHCVGIKQTILFPFVTLGSLINFCDCLMAGGTDENNHSEVGSSYIHFNYTPNQDKATPSLIGDVSNGVMLTQRPIFLGGQGGLVGPVTIPYGTIVAAGTIVRKDIRKANRLLLGQANLNKDMSFHPGLYSQVKRIVEKNIHFISSLIALRRWYLDVRSTFFSSDFLSQALFKGACTTLDRALEERLKRLGQVAARMPRSIEIWNEMTSGKAPEEGIRRKQELFDQWDEVEDALRASMDEWGDATLRDAFLNSIDQGKREWGNDYLSVIRGLSPEDGKLGSLWLDGLIRNIKSRVLDLIPSHKPGVRQ